jgi:ribosome maturation factor RimP
MDLLGKIKDLAETALNELDALKGEELSPESQVGGHFIVEVLLFSKQRPAKLMVIVDGDHGVTIDVCANLSRKLAAVMDEQNLLDEAYNLEVSTPGIDQPLKLKRQYFKNKGRQFKVHLKDKAIVQGKLEDVTEEKLTIVEIVSKKESKTTEVLFDQIEKAYVMVSFKQN